jgi:hypothetical protein
LYSRNFHKEDINEALNKLSKVISRSSAEISIDAIGYGKYVDYILMHKLV